MDYCKLCGKSIKPYQLSTKSFSAGTIFASSVNNSGNSNLNPALGYGVTRGSSSRSHLGCQKQYGKKGIWWTIRLNPKKSKY